MTPSWVTAFLDLPERNFEKGVVFWAEVTGYAVSSARGDADEFATLVPRDGDDFLRVQRIQHGPDGPGRVHLDVHVTDPRAGADRAVDLGATEQPATDAGQDFVVLTSPGGAEFCFVDHPTDARAPTRAHGGQPVRPLVRPRPVSWPEGRSLVDQVCFDIGPGAYDRECAFWRDLTGWKLVASPTSPEFSALVRPAGQPLRFLLQRLDDEQPMVTAHLDLACSDRASETRRHTTLGAHVTSVQDHCTVLADPTGAAYCITDRDPATGLLG